MITIFNRRELVFTYDMKIQARVREILSVNNIEYIIDPFCSLWASGPAEYKIYVKKTDYERASYLIRDVF